MNGRWTRTPRLAVVLTLAVVAAFVVIATAGLLAQRAAQRSVAAISSAHRATIFARARADLAETCALPEAADGALRDHCFAQARFVSLFPECDAACARAARPWLVQGRR